MLINIFKASLVFVRVGLLSVWTLSQFGFEFFQMNREDKSAPDQRGNKLTFNACHRSFISKSQATSSIREATQSRRNILSLHKTTSTTAMHVR